VTERVARAETFLGRLRGLMFRRPLEEGEGLFLAGTNGVHMLFMRFAIDCLFVARPAADGSQRIVGVRHQLPPWRGVVWWVRGASGVYELPAGTLARHGPGVAVGEEVRLEPASAGGG